MSYSTVRRNTFSSSRNGRGVGVNRRVPTSNDTPQQSFRGGTISTMNRNGNGNGNGNGRRRNGNGGRRNGGLGASPNGNGGGQQQQQQYYINCATGNADNNCQCPVLTPDRNPEAVCAALQTLREAQNLENLTSQEIQRIAEALSVLVINTQHVFSIRTVYGRLRVSGTKDSVACAGFHAEVYPGVSSIDQVYNTDESGSTGTAGSMCMVAPQLPDDVNLLNYPLCCLEYISFTLRVDPLEEAIFGNLGSVIRCTLFVNMSEYNLDDYNPEDPVPADQIIAISVPISAKDDGNTYLYELKISDPIWTQDTFGETNYGLSRTADVANPLSVDDEGKPLTSLLGYDVAKLWSGKQKVPLFPLNASVQPINFIVGGDDIGVAVKTTMNDFTIGFSSGVNIVLTTDETGTNGNNGG